MYISEFSGAPEVSEFSKFLEFSKNSEFSEKNKNLKQNNLLTLKNLNTMEVKTTQVSHSSILLSSISKQRDTSIRTSVLTATQVATIQTLPTLWQKLLKKVNATLASLSAVVVREWQ